MRKFLLLNLLLFCAITIYAQFRTEKAASDIANSFIQTDSNLKSIQTSGSSKASVTLAYKCANNDRLRTSGKESAYYYVFNIENNGGFIIVSGDERAKDILGYSDDGSFDITNIPENFRYWLSFYQDELEYLENNPESFNSTNNAFKQVYASSVAPLLGKIKWGQSAPYNNLCPLRKSTSTTAVAGCVATAMAQVMAYHKWPVNGTGSNTYTTTDVIGNISANFGQTSYDWDNMTPTYGTSSTEIQKRAVATLIFHCGVSVNMAYSSSSGAYATDMATALVNNFGYDSNIQMIRRDYHPKQEWIDIIKNELDNSRPVLYGGQAIDGGHRFVCDGYDTSGLFHINWGWTGMSDGYFEVSALTPSAQGTGGASGGYNIAQDVVIGIQKPTGTTTPIYQIHGIAESSVTTVALNTNLSLGIKISNAGLFQFNGFFNLALYDKNDNFVSTLLNTNISYTLNSGAGISGSRTGKIPTGIASGNYKMYLVYKSNEQLQWSKSMAKVGADNFVNVTIAGNQATFTTSVQNLSLSLLSLTANNKLYQQKTGKFTGTIKNNGTTEFKSMVALKLVADSDGAISYLTNDPVNIVPGETLNIDFVENIGVSPGNYKLYLIYRSDNSQSTATPNYAQYQELGSPINVTVAATPVSNIINLAMTTAISFADNNHVTPDNFNLTVKIKNSGDFYEDNIVIYYENPFGTENYTSFDRQKATIDAGETVTLNFTNAPSISFGQQKVAVTYRNYNNSRYYFLTPSENNKLTFNFEESVSTGINEVEGGQEVAVYPNPATDYLYLKSEETVSAVSLYDLSGKQLITLNPRTSGEISIPVHNLSNGTYILQWISQAGVKSSKFVKH